MKKILTSILFLLTVVGVKADEGMWMITNLSARTDSILRRMGLELTHDQIFSTEHPSLNSCIVQFGGFCSGSVVSADGLVFTNHHCGYEAIQTHSSTEHDYLRDGFFAKKFKDELPNEGLYVDFHLNTFEVTDRMNGAILTDAEKDSIAQVIQQELSDSVNFIHAVVVPYYKGSKYYVSIYQRFNDVRLVFAPPQCLGKHGGDTDNWVWPRQTCDFSVFRIYADKNNRPAEYSTKNVPYHPVQYAHISLDGYQPGTFCMTFGYPGSTNRYLSSYGIKNTMRVTNDLRIQVRGVKQEILQKAMQSSDDLRIKYSSKYAQSSNYWKYSIGQNKALDELGVVAEKEALERELVAWNPAIQAVLDSLRVGYERTFNDRYMLQLWEESFWGGSDIMQFVISNMIGAVEDKEKDFKKRVEKAYKDIDIDTDRRVFAAMLKNYRRQVPSPEYLPSIYTEIIDSTFNGSCDRFADLIYDTSSFTKPDRMAEVKSIEEMEEDPMFSVALSLIEAVYKVYAPNKTEEYERQLGDAIRQMNRDKEYYPDANFTLRMSYGIVEGYTPANGPTYSCFTPSQSIIDKYEKQGDNPDYELLPSVYEWLKKGDWGKRYVDAKSGDLQLCFLTNNDITGGNSGSGMYDGKGRLIGLAFDGNWEAMSGDLKFDTNLQRCIGVDIRYVLSVIEQYGGAKRLIKELTFD